ncbi:MAG: hypothetical protein R2848_04660 [Thermomicrobiales bacterium]
MPRQVGPVIGRAIKDATGSFERALLLLPVLAIGMIVVSLFAPRRSNPEGRKTTNHRQVRRAQLRIQEAFPLIDTAPKITNRESLLERIGGSTR